MIGEIIVAVACNLVAALILLYGILTAKSNGFRVTLIRFGGAVAGLVGGYFVTPVVSDAVYGIDKVPELFSQIGVSKGTLSSCVFFLFFILVCLLTLIVSSIVKHALINKLKDKKLNVAKMKRAKSINPKAEKAVRKAEQKVAKSNYCSRCKWYTKLLSCFVGGIVSVVTGIVVLMPFGYIGKDIDAKSDKQYLVDGYEYTLNGVIPESVFDWVISNEVEEEVETPSDSEQPEETVPQE